MTVTTSPQAWSVEAAASMSHARAHRFRLRRAGILNVWQYDDQEFRLADGRMLLRGANGAGKSKTLEMLLPYVLDGDKARITASARHHTSLLWLMTDGYEGHGRIGYLWVEFARPTDDGADETFTCGVGIRSSASARTATPWYFTTSQRIGHDLSLEDDAGPMSRPRLVERIGEHGQVFEHPRAYKEHIGRTLFGLGVQQYDEVLRLLYWLRQPQVGEDIEPARLAGQLAQALPQLDEQAVRAAGDTFDELAAFGEEIERRSRASEALAGLAAAYGRYARSVAGMRGTTVVDVLKEERRRVTELRRRRRELGETLERRQQVDKQIGEQRAGVDQDRARIRELEASPEARDQRRLGELADLVRERRRVAGSVAGQAERAADQWARREERLAADGAELADRLQRSVQRAREADRSMQQVGAAAGLLPPVVLVAQRLADAQHAGQLMDALEGFLPTVDAASAEVGGRQAAVTIVRGAVAAVGEERRQTATAEERAAETERRWEESRGRRVEAEQTVEAEEQQLWTAIQRWAALEAAPAVQLPAEITPSVVDGLADWGRAAAAPMLGDLRSAEQTAALARDRAAETLADLVRRRKQIEQQVDPAPPEPALARTPRSDGAPLWRLVDFTDQLAAEDRAGLEAALQASGLLDAWVRPDGAVLDAEQRDTVLPAGPALTGGTLADVLLPDCPPDADVTAEVVGGVLRRVGLGDEATADAARLGLDGTWRLGPLQGRAEKAQAQYVGATARAEERRRRLREIDDAAATARDALDRAATQATEIAGQIAALEEWARAVPATQPLLQAWARLEERTAAANRDERDNAGAQQAAHEARQRLRERRHELELLARQHDVPTETEALAALEQRLRGLADDVRRIGAEVPGQARELRRWGGERTALDAEAETVAAVRVDADAARESAEQAASALSELTAAVGATVRDLQQRLDELRGSERAREEALGRLADDAGDLRRAEGKVEGAVAQAEAQVAEHRLRRSASLAELAELAGVPGLLESASALASAEPPDRAVLRQAGGVPAEEPVPAEVATVAQSLAALVDADAVDVNVVWRAYNEATSGPAADYEPRVVELGELVAVTGRDEGSESPIGALAMRVAAGVERDRELLTQRERERFEQHILGELGDAIRRRRLEAEELVEAMNGLLAGVKTSQGIRVRLDWRLRDDVSPEAGESVRLLAQPVGALLPEERATLRDSLHRLIEASRAERPELTYSEHLSSALDYREWSAFRIRYTRPETEGRWLDLHRRSPLSQGEQKVLCYLPLFAAAAAHFESLAGAAPHAPRLVLLDDAFPKIDVRTHPLLFGLLVQLDLDFVITSERLWGDHETVPSLAIYEALRDPSQRGIAQFEYRWDGRQLRAIG